MPRNRSKITTVLSYLPLLIAGLFLTLELAVRFFPNQLGSPHPLVLRKNMQAYSYFEWTDTYFRDASTPPVIGTLLLYEPYSLWKHGDKKTETINIINGYRVTWTPVEDRSKADYVIFVFGGSTILGSEVPDEFTIPSLIAKQLNTLSSKYRYVVNNYSASGFVNDNEVHLLVDLLRKGERPDAVIFYDGANEIINKVARGLPHFGYVLFNSLMSRPTKTEYLGRLVRQSRLISLLLRKKWSFIEDNNRLRLNASAMLENYRNNVEVVRRIGRVYGFEVFFFWQPDIFAGGKVLTEEERGVREEFRGLKAAHEVTVEVMKEKGFFRKVGIIDLRGSVDDIKESIFLDVSHVTSIGNEVVGKAIVSHMHERIKKQ
jgi:hypothetical protein